jgi:hypothetical protein
MIRPKMMTYAVLIRLLTMSIVWLTMLVWFLNAYRANCATGVGIFIVLALILIVAGTERSYFHRRALFNECLHHEGRLFHIFHNRILLTVRETLYGAVLALFLMISSLLFEPRQWSLLFADLLVLTLLIPRLAIAMGNEIRDEYRFALARQWSMWISVVLLWGEAVLVLVFSPPEDYFGMRWQEVVTYGVAEPEVLCPLLKSATEVYAVGQALAIWAVQNAGRVINDPTQSVMVWVGLTTLLGFTFLVALAYSRALVGVMGRPWEMWQSFSGGAAPAEVPRRVEGINLS